MKQFEVKRKQIEYLAKAFEIVLFLMIKKKLGLEGSGFFLVPLMIFVMTWTFVGESLPDVLAKMIRARRIKGQIKSVKYMRWYSFVCQLFMGIIGTLIMLTLGTFLGEKVFGCPYASLMIWVLSPLLFLRGMSSLLLGYCQGEGFELPAVITCLLRLVMIYVFGVIFGTVSGEYGQKVSTLLKQERYVSMYVGEGWCLAMVTAELVILLILLFSFLGMRRKKNTGDYETTKASVSFRGYVNAAFTNMIFKSLIIFLETLPFAYGMIAFYHQEGSTAPMNYGKYFVGYLAICLLFIRLISAVSVPYWGKVAGYFKQDEVRLGRVCFHAGIHLVLGLSMILCVGISAMASQAGALAGFTSPELAKIVLQGSLLIPFVSLEFYFSRMLMRFRKNLLATGMMLLSDVIFVMVFSMMRADEKLGLLSLTYASLISFGVAAFLLGAITIQLVGGRLNWIKAVVLPVGLAVAIGILQALCVKFMGDKLESLYVVLLIGGFGFITYWCALLLLRNFGEEELSVMPFGKTLISLGKMLGIF